MMTRTQITLDAEIQKKAKKKAAEMGVSLAEYIRLLLDNDLRRPAQAIDVTCMFDLGSSGQADIAEKKDDMIAEAILQQHAKQ